MITTEKAQIIKTVFGISLTKPDAEWDDNPKLGTLVALLINMHELLEDTIRALDLQFHGAELDGKPIKNKFLFKISDPEISEEQKLKYREKVKTVYTALYTMLSPYSDVVETILIDTEEELSIEMKLIC